MNIKFIKDFKTKSDFNSIKHKKRCWNKCHLCGQLWNDIQTKNVHMIFYHDQEQWINGNGTFFICDNCIPQMKIK